MVSLPLVPTLDYAYIDPGSGSLILQVLVGGVAAVAVMAKVVAPRARVSGHPQAHERVDPRTR
jgi:hypothetical protein